MAGFPLAAIGAGIGQFFQNYEQQKRSQQQRALEQLQADALRQNQLRQQKQDQASGLLFNSLLGGESGQTGQAQPFTMPSLGGGQVGGGGGYGDLSGLANLGGGAGAMGPPATSGGQRDVPGTIMHDAGGDYRIPQTYGSKFADEILFGPQRTRSGGDLGGGLRAGGALTGNPFVDKLVSLGVKPEVASGAVEYMRRNESGLRPDAVNPSSGALGAAQWLGPRKRALQGQYGAAPGLSQQADFMGQELQGPEGRTLAALRGASSGRQGYDIWGRDYERPGGAALAKAGVGGASPIHQEAQQAALGAAQITPPEVYGRMSLRGLAQQIDKANPGADPVVKMMALEQAAKLLAPSDQRAWEMFKLQHDDAIRQSTQMESERFQVQQQQSSQAFSRSEREAARGDREPKLFADEQGNQHWLKPGQDVPQGWRETSPGGSRVGRPENIVAFKDGEKVFEGSATYDPQRSGWINTADGKPIDADRFETTGKGGAISGGRGGAQVQRQIISGREIQSDLEAITKLPITVTRGMFGGRTQGPGLTDALKENLAETLTPEDAQLANSALAGLGRELSIVTSPVYGGRWASDQFGALTLKEGQTVAVKLYNIARMRQVADNALEGIINTDWVGNEQKKYAQQIRDEINKAVPWTIQDVLAFRSNGKDGQSFSDFVKSHNISGAAGRGGGGTGGGEEQPIPRGLKNADGSTPSDGDAFKMKDGSTWVVRGGQLVKTPGAVNAAPAPEGPPT